MKSFYPISLGCAKNLVDSEVMIGVLLEERWQLAEQAESADLILINTCGFIQPAVEEAVDEILAAAKITAEKEGAKLVVAGCLVQRYKESLIAELPEVDLFIGTEAPEMLPQLLGSLFSESGQEEGQKTAEKLILPPPFLMSHRSPRQLTTTGTAWLKITEGCNNRCAFCMIPSIRGALRSRTSEDIVLEARRLERQGVREICLIAQDTTAYGDDLAPSENIHSLLEKLLTETTIPWLRLLYLYPSGVTDSLISLLAKEERIVPYLDIPFQHISTKILRRMNRRHSGEDVEELIEKLRRAIPDLALRSTLLVGFPGETEADFLQLEDFLRRYRLDHVGIFPYCNEEGAAAEHFDGAVPEEERLRRRDYLLGIQQDISTENQQKYLGRVEPVLVQGISAETELLLEGRSRFQAPEVDGVVYINEGSARAGEIVMVRIDEAYEYDLVGGIVG